MDSRILQEILDFAVEAAAAAGELTLRHFNAGAGCPYELKSDRSPVTAADRGAEQLLRERIEKAFPGHGIVGEEFGETHGRAAADGTRERARWILDPIDGTVSLISGVPLYSVLLGFEMQGEMLAGVIHMPALRETVYAARGLGCWWCTADSRESLRRARVSEAAELSEARLLSCGARWMQQCGRGAAFARLCERCGIERGWCDGYAYALLATGRAEIVLDPRMSIWDTAALLPVVTEAGGTLTDWLGRATHTAGEAVATNGRLFEPVMAAIHQ